MKRHLLVFLVIVLALFNVFTYAFLTKKVEQTELKLTKTKDRLEEQLLQSEGAVLEAKHFTLERNQQAQDYFEDPNTGWFMHHEDIIEKVTKKLLSFNDLPDGNSYINYPPMDGKKFVVNRVLLLNHRVLIADFTNGTYTGQILVDYFVNQDNTIDFETKQTFIFTK